MASGSGGVTKLGSGVLTLTGTNTYSGTTTISAGTVSIGAGGTTGSLASAQLANDGTVQFNPAAGESVRTTLGARYSPGDYRVLNAAYRVQRDVNLQRDVSELLDVGWQWPLSDLFGDTAAATTRIAARWLRCV